MLLFQGEHSFSIWNITWCMYLYLVIPFMVTAEHSSLEGDLIVCVTHIEGLVGIGHYIIIMCVETINTKWIIKDSIQLHVLISAPPKTNKFSRNWLFKVPSSYLLVILHFLELEVHISKSFCSVTSWDKCLCHLKLSEWHIDLQKWCRSMYMFVFINKVNNFTYYIAVLFFSFEITSGRADTQTSWNIDISHDGPYNNLQQGI